MGYLSDNRRWFGNKVRTSQNYFLDFFVWQKKSFIVTESIMKPRKLLGLGTSCRLSSFTRKADLNIGAQNLQQIMSSKKMTSLRPFNLK